MAKDTINLGEGNIKSLLFKLALPSIIAQVVNLLYSIVDRIFIGRIPDGEIAMAGVGIAFPIIMLVAAFSALVGMGGAPLAAIKMGEGDEDGAEQILTNSFTVLIIISIILTTLILAFKEPMLWAFGASEATIDYAVNYLTIYMIGTISVQIALGMNPFINTQGFAKVGMTTVIIGAIINIVLDPILIFGFNMGVKGAALATIIAQTASALWVIKFLLRKDIKLKLRKKYLKPKIKIVKNILALGISPFVMQSTESLVLISLNSMLLKHGGDPAVSSMTIMSSVMQMITLPVRGLTQGAQPLMSYNYGARQMSRVKETFKLLFKLTVFFTTLMWLLVMTVPQIFATLFSNDPELIAITSWSMRIYFAGIFAFGAQLACQQTFLSLGMAKVSLILASLRKIVLLVPLIFIIPIFMEDKVMGILLAEPVADILAAVTTVITFSIFYKTVLIQDDIGA